MIHRPAKLIAGAAGLAFLGFAAQPSLALTSAECSALYKAAQQAKTLDGMSWNQFQKDKCAAPAEAAAAAPVKAAEAKPTEAPKAPEAKPAEAKPAEAKVAQAAAPAPKAEAKADAAKALSSQECSLKYKEAKAAKTLNGMKWNDFRKSQCGPGASPPAGKVEAATAASSASAANAVFPTALAAKYASEKPGRARMHTCLDQYKANKATNANGGLKWIQRTGGGYYSECNKRLKQKN